MAENRVTHGGLEVFTQPDTQKARVTGAGMEAYVVSDTQKARVTAAGLEVYVVPASAAGKSIVMVIS